MNIFEKRLKRENEWQKKIAVRHLAEINELKERINLLQIENDEKNEIIHSVDRLREELKECVEDINKQRFEYRKLINEIRQMRDVINDTHFNGKWSFIKLFIK